MSWLEPLRTFFGSESDEPAPVEKTSSLDPHWTPRELTGIAGITRIGQANGNRGLMELAQQAGYNTVVPPPDYINSWRDEGFDTNIFSKITPGRLITLLCDISPEVSRSFWDSLRFCNPGWEVIVTLPGSDKPNPRGKKVIDDFLDRLTALYGSMDVVFGRLYAAAIVRGAFFSELVFAKDGTTAIDLATPDPLLVRFRKVKDPDRGSIWEMGQLNFGSPGSGLTIAAGLAPSTADAFVPFTSERVQYVPVDPMPGSPYGRSLMSPVVFPAVYLISLLNDLKRVTSQQGMPRLDIEVDLQSLAAVMPEELASDPQTFNRWVRAAIAEIKEVYARLQPDQAFVHTSMIKLNGNAGTVDVNSLGSINTIIQSLERFMVKALKTMPLLMGDTAGMSEANANRQWEVYVAGVKQLQHYCENMLERQLGLVLRAHGIQGTAKIRFAELRTAELLRDAMYKQLHIANTLSEYLIGARDFDEMVVMLTGHMPPTGSKEPKFIPKNFIPFGAANATKAESTQEDSSEPGQEGGDRDLSAMVEQEVNKLLRRQLLSNAGLLQLAGGEEPAA